MNFVLQLKMPHQNDEEDLGEAPLEAVETEQPAPPAEAKAEAAEDSQPAPDDKMGEVIALDAFRKK